MFVYKLFSFWQPKNKSQNPLNWKITSSKLTYRKSNTLSYIIPKKQDNNARELLYVRYREKKDSIFSRKLIQSRWEIRRRNVLSCCSKPAWVLGASPPRAARDAEVFLTAGSPREPLQSSAWPCSCRQQRGHSHCTKRPHESWWSPPHVLGPCPHLWNNL